MPKNRRFLRRTAALILAVLLLAAAMPSALAADTRTGTVSAPTGILLLLASPGGESAGEVPDGSAVSILSEETDANGTLWYYIQKPGGETGYVPAESVTLSEQETTPTPEETPASEPEPTAANDRDAYLTQLRVLGFPESYLEGLWQLHSRYPAWEFRPFFTNVDWNTAVNEENVLGKSLVWGSAPSSWKSTQEGAFNWTDNTWIELDSGGWVAASREIIAHYMDPRNFLDSSAVFQFLYQGYDAASQTRESLAVLVSGTFLADTTYDTDLDTSNGVNTYAETLYTAGADCGVSPYILAAMMLQEMGTNGASDSISGTAAFLGTITPSTSALTRPRSIPPWSADCGTPAAAITGAAPRGDGRGTAYIKPSAAARPSMPRTMLPRDRIRSISSASTCRARTCTGTST